jgi:hypothetical protein|tara:strand:+ start:1147 stop:1518 length:372 start_codon:yes stop_codon:yes gene_type:complete
MIKKETKFWHEIKAFNIKNNCKLSFTRVENSAAHGTPDLLVCNNSGHFFTIELKLRLAKNFRFSPHQIGFHLRHPHNTFIMAKALDPLAIKLYEGSKIQDLVTGSAEPVATGLESSFKFLQKV